MYNCSEVRLVGQQVINPSPFPAFAAKVLACFCAVLLGDDFLARFILYDFWLVGRSVRI